MTFSKIRFSKLKRYTFIDINDVEIGSLEDIVIDQTTLRPTYLILGAGFFEELMEELGKKADVDELAPLEIIKQLEHEVMEIGVPVEDLKTTNENGKLPFEGIKFSELQKYQILEKSEKFEGKLIDIEIDGVNASYLFDPISLREGLRMEGYGQRFDISFVSTDIKITGKNKIVLPSTSEDILTLIRKKIQPKNSGKSIVHWVNENYS